jgi:adenosylcobyric acid synthase
MGSTTLGPQARPLLETEHGADGACNHDGRVLGSYLHGFFDSEAILAELMSYFGCPAELPLISREMVKAHEYDRLARELRQALDMEKIYEIAGIS